MVKQQIFEHDLQHFVEILDLPLVDFMDWRLKSSQPFTTDFKERTVQTDKVEAQLPLGLLESWFRCNIMRALRPEEDDIGWGGG